MSPPAESLSELVIHASYSRWSKMSTRPFSSHVGTGLQGAASNLFVSLVFQVSGIDVLDRQLVISMLTEIYVHASELVRIASLNVEFEMYARHDWGSCGAALARRIQESATSLNTTSSHVDFIFTALVGG